MSSTEKTTDDQTLFLREAELARRWRLSPRTLQRRRKGRSGPPWLNLGGRIVYAIEDVRRSRNGMSRAGGEEPR